MDEDEQFQLAFGEQTNIPPFMRDKINDIKSNNPDCIELNLQYQCLSYLFSDLALQLIGRYIANNTILEYVGLECVGLTDEKMSQLFGTLIKSDSIKELDLDYNMFNISGDFGLGYTLVNSKIAIDIEPVFSKNLIGLFKGDVNVNAFQSSLGFSMTIRY